MVVNTHWPCSLILHTQSLVLNSKLGGGWQHQECPSDFTMDKGKPTHIVVSAGANSFDIYADKANYSYRYRDEVTKVTRIQCQGNGTAIALAMGKVSGTSRSTGKFYYYNYY